MSLFFYAAPIDATLNATRCKGIPDGAFHGDFANIALAGAIHGRVYRCAPANNIMGFAGIHWSGCRNFPVNSNNRSFVFRHKAVYDGFPDAAVSTLFSIQGTGFYPKLNTLVFHHWTDGHFRVAVYSGNTAGVDSLQITSTPVSFTRGVSYDIVITWDSTGTGGFNVYVDGVQVVSNFAVGQNFLSVTQTSLIGSISLGQGGIFVNNAGSLVEEFAIYDEIINPAPFIGAARTTPISTVASPGISWPINTQVVNTQTWNEYGVTKTGTVVVGCDYPIEEEVKDGVVYSNGLLVGSFGRHIPLTNPYWAPLEVQSEIYEILNGDAALTTLLGANKIFDFVPDKTPYPYVTVNALPFISRDNATHDGLECEFQLNVWYQPGKASTTSRGNKPVQLIQKRLDELLQNRKICVNGWNTLQLRRSFIDILVESDNVTRHGIQRFKLFLGSKD